MRVLSILHYSFFGGPHNHIIQIASVLEKHGVELIAVLPNEPGNAARRLEEAGIRTYTIPLHRLRRSYNPLVHLRYVASLAKDIQRLRTLIRQEKADVVMINGAENPHGAIAGKLERTGVLWFFLGPGIPAPVRLGATFLAQRLAGAVMVTGTTMLKQYPGLSSMGQRVLPYYPLVDPDHFHAEHQQNRTLHQQLGLPADTPVVGALGNINQAKGYEYFIEAAALVQSQIPEARFLIVGSLLPTQRSYYTKMRRLIERLGLRLGEDIIIYSPSGDTSEALALFDVYVQSSVAEGISTALLEGLAMARPVVATDVGSTAEVLTHGQNGFLVKPADPEALAARIIQLLSNPTMAKEMGCQGRQTVIKRFSLQQAVEQHLQALRLAIAQTNRAT